MDHKTTQPLVVHANGHTTFEFDKNGKHALYTWTLDGISHINLAHLCIGFNIFQTLDDDSAAIAELLGKHLDFELTISNNKNYFTMVSKSKDYSKTVGYIPDLKLTYKDNEATLHSEGAEFIFMNPCGGQWLIELDLVDKQFQKSEMRENFNVGGMALTLFTRGFDTLNKRYVSYDEFHKFNISVSSCRMQTENMSD